MSLIITATDFTDTANAALEYACLLATNYKASVVVMHSYTVPVTINDNPMPVMPIEESRAIAEKAMGKLIDNLTVTFPDIAINSHVVFGDITEEITEYAKTNQPWLVVVGNSLNEEDTVWFGGNLLTLMRELPYPVLAVPHGATYRPVQKMCFACDYKKGTENLPFNSLLAIVEATKANLHILNIDHDNNAFKPDTPVIAEELHIHLKAANPEYHYLDSTNIDDSIIEFVNLNHIDWLVVAPHKHNFFESLFRKSHTKELAKHVSVPMLSVH